MPEILKETEIKQILTFGNPCYIHSNLCESASFSSVEFSASPWIPIPPSLPHSRRSFDQLFKHYIHHCVIASIKPSWSTPVMPSPFHLYYFFSIKKKKQRFLPLFYSCRVTASHPSRLPLPLVARPRCPKKRHSSFLSGPCPPLPLWLLLCIYSFCIGSLY